MTTNIQLYIQKILIMVNHVPILRMLPRSIYHLAIKILQRECRHHPTILSVYIRGSFAEGTWVAGRSDIDLTIVLKNDLELAEEQAAIKKIKKRYSFIQKIFPMLGEIEYILEHHIFACCRYSYNGYQASTWKLLYGKENVARYSYDGDADTIIIDRLVRLILIHVYLFCPKLKTANWQQMDLHILSRVVRKAQRLSPVEGPVNVNSHFDNPSQALLSIVKLLDDNCCCNDLLKTTCDVTELMSEIQDCTNKEVDNALNHKLNAIGISSSLDNFVFSIFRQYDVTYAVLKKDSLNDKNITAIFDVLQQFFGNVVFMTLPVLQFYFQYCNPIQCATMRHDGKLLAGANILQKVKLPSQNVLKIAFANNSVAVFSDIYQQDWASFDSDHYEYCLYGWYFRTLHFLENAEIIISYELVKKYYAQEHPQWSLEVEKTKPSNRQLLIRKICDKIAHVLETQKRAA